jgi:hypothetical protein
MFQIVFNTLSFYCKDFLVRIQDHFMPDNTNNSILFNTGMPRQSVAFNTLGALSMSQIYLAEHIFVTKVHWCKKKTTPYHEFLVFYLKEHEVPERGPACKSVMVIDRCANPFNNTDPAITHPNNERVEPTILEDGEPSASPSTPSQIRPKKSSLQSLPKSTDSFSPSKEKNAYDGLYFSDGTDAFLKEPPWKSYGTCEGFTIHGELFSATQLAVLAHTIHSNHNQYNIWHYHCYWYAEALYNTIKLILDRNSGPDVKTYMNDPRILRPGLQVGTFKLSPKAMKTVTKSDPQVHEAIYKQYTLD